MPRFISGLLVLAAAAILCAAPVMSGPAVAKAGMKTCKSKVPATGKVKVWRCKTDVPCCVSHELGLYVCGSPMVGCL